MAFSRRKTEVSAESALKSKQRQKSQEGMRETIEAVAIAFILAFVFKTFEAEAFVIPTGSMAPTLYGRHKEVVCSGCSLPYTVGASQEIDQDTGILSHDPRHPRLRDSVCPNCRFTNDIYSAPVFNGDRIVVNKQVSRYKRFNVVVFKNPEEPHVNYIKRLVGLPGETLRIRQGDIQTRARDEDPWMIQRKPDPETQNDIQLLVYDDEYPPRALLNAGAEERWAPAAYSGSDQTMGGWPTVDNAWTPDRTARSFQLDANDSQQHWLRYRHLVASPMHWDMAAESGKLTTPLEPQLIGDFCGFNADGRSDSELYWVSDLSVDARIRIESLTSTASLVFELVEGIRTVRCSIDPNTGKAELSVIDNASDGRSPAPLATVQTEIQGPGAYDVSFANVDDRILLWVNGELIPAADASLLPTPELNLPSDKDLAPAGIAASGMKVEVSGLKLRRDIYYRNDVMKFDREDVISPDPMVHDPATITEVSSGSFHNLTLRSPENYARTYAQMLKAQEEEFGDHLLFRLEEGEYLMFGDNSPASKDGRLFDYYSRPLRGVESNRYAVREQDLIGEALWIFWPHGVPFLNDGKGYPIINHKRYTRDGRLTRDETYPLYSAPFYPNLSRMKVIR